MITLRDQTVGTTFARLVGLAFGIIGLGLAALAGDFLLDLFEHRESFDMTAEPAEVAKAAVFLIVVASIAWFCTSTGWRLALNRPNRYGSIIRPWAWRTLAAIFLLLAITLVVFAWMDASLLSAWPVLGAAAFALLCFLCFWRVRMLGRLLQPDLPSNTALEPTHVEKGV